MMRCCTINKSITCRGIFLDRSSFEEKCIYFTTYLISCPIFSQATSSGATLHVSKGYSGDVTFTGILTVGTEVCTISMCVAIETTSTLATASALFATSTPSTNSPTTPSTSVEKTVRVNLLAHGFEVSLELQN